jgi:hypothetical protein
MVEMPQQTTPAAPPAPAPPGTPVAAQAPATTGLNLAPFSANQLRRMLQELRSQRQDLADRRSALGDAFEAASGDNRASMVPRIRTLDDNIVRYEMEIDRVGRTFAARAGGETTTLPPDRIPGNYMKDDDAAQMAFGFSFMTAVLVFLFTRRLVRRKYQRVPPAQQVNLIASNERLERIEQAVDTIAVEVERVSENQRFMTRLMTETQLGDTIKDVRKSTELAKSAAENT